jgi:hypothetical protein
MKILPTPPTFKELPALDRPAHEAPFVANDLAGERGEELA